MIKIKTVVLTTLCTLSFSALSASNVPVCKQLSEPVTQVEESVHELINQAEKFSNRGKHCKAARSLQLSFIKNQEVALENGVDLKILEELNEGKFLNDYMTFLLALKKMHKNHPQSEYMDYMLTQSYVKNLPQSGDKTPAGNFINPDGTSVGLVKEAKIVQSRFLVKYPHSQFLEKVEKDSLRTQEIALAQAIANVESDYEQIKKNPDARLVNFYASQLAKSMKENNAPTQRTEALIFLFNLYKDQKNDLASRENIASIHSLLSTTYKSKRDAKKIARFMKKNGISQGSTLDFNSFVQKISSASSLDADLLSEKDLKSLLKRKKGNDKSIFLPITVTSKEKQIILRTLGVVGVMLAFDRPMMDFVQNNHSAGVDRFVEVTNSFGELSGLGPVIGGSMALGLVFKNDQLKRAAVRSVGAALIGQLTVEFLKAMTHRARPREDQGPYHFEGADWQSDNTSFPSGHSAGAWSVMTVFATEFKDTKIVPVLAYSLAAMTSFSRVYKNAHWVSDVTLGALIGWASGKLMYKLFKKKSDSRVSVAPVMGDMSGGSVTIRSEGQETLKAWPLDYYNLVNGQ